MLGGKDVVIGIGGAGKGIPEGIPEIVDKIRGIWGKPLADIPGCCKKASESKGIGIGVIFDIIIGPPGSGIKIKPGIKPPPIEDIVAALCKFFGDTKYPAKNCEKGAALQPPGKKYTSCVSCCDKVYGDGKPGHGICLQNCLSKFPFDDIRMTLT